MSQRLTHTPPAPAYGMYNGQINNSCTSDDPSYNPATHRYSSYHHNQSATTPSGQVGAQHWGYDNPKHMASYGGVNNPLSAPQNSVQPYPPPTNNYHAPYETMPAAGTIQASTPYYAHDPSFEKYSNYSYTSTTMQSSAEYSSGSLPASTMNATILQSMPYPAAHPMLHVDPHTRPSKLIHSTSSPQEGSSKHATSSRTHARAPSPQLLPRERYLPSETPVQPGSRPSYYSSQPAAQDPGPSSTEHDREQRKPRKASRSSKLDGIHKDQMQRFRVVDSGPGPSSSGTKRTRSPGSDALPDTRKGKSKPGLSQEKEAAAKRKKEAVRVQAYRDQLDALYAELRALLYPDEENTKLAPSNHGKIKCIRDAIERLTNSTPHSVWKREEAKLKAEISALQEKDRRYQEERRELVATSNAYMQQISVLLRMVEDLRRSAASNGNQG